jgi:hypothetical protein
MHHAGGLAEKQKTQLIAEISEIVLFEPFFLCIIFRRLTSKVCPENLISFPIIVVKKVETTHIIIFEKIKNN